MAQRTQVTLRRIICKATEFTNGQTIECMLVNSKTIKCMGKENSHGLMEGLMRDSMSMIKSRDEVFILGLMEESTTESG